MKYLKDLFKLLKKIFKAKNIIILRCDNCDSMDLSIVDNKVFRKKLGLEDNKIISVEYKLKCNNCKTESKVKEVWKVRE